MKLFIAILLTSTVLLSEFVSAIELVSIQDHHLESSYEGEVEKELSENLEDVVKIKFETPAFSDVDELKNNNDARFAWFTSTPYLEIHSPPPEV